MFPVLLLVVALDIFAWDIADERERRRRDRAILEGMADDVVYRGKLTRREDQTCKLHDERGRLMRQLLNGLQVLSQAAAKELAQATTVRKTKGRRKK